jgi:hypothetical protein
MGVELADIPPLHARPRKSPRSQGAPWPVSVVAAAHSCPWAPIIRPRSHHCLVTGRRDRMAGRPWPLLIVGRNMTAGDVDALINVRRSDEGDDLCVCVLVCEICQGVGGIGRP